MPVLIYSHTVTPRLQYVTNFLSQYFEHTFLLTTNWQYFIGADKAKINYAATNNEGHALWIQPSGLLFSSGIKDLSITSFDHAQGYKAFFKSEGVIGFDLFSAIFYLLSRYEEYLPHQKDMYGRYAHENSLAHKNNFLNLPLINIWLDDFRKIIQEEYQISNIKSQTFKFLPTYDIDIAWSYHHKGLFRNVGGALKTMANGQWSMVRERVSVLRKKEQDPYDSYEWLNTLHQQYSLQPLYFFHAGQRRNQYDKNIATYRKAFQQLVKQQAQRYTIGLHPSWHSGDESPYIQKEKAILEAITEQPITISRQHYIRFTLPETFRILLEAGITEDHSMGYGSINGFRASVAVPFYWYDLEKETTTTLLLHPFCFMDANALFEQKLSAQEAFEELIHYYEVLKRYGGTMITIWHNNILGTGTSNKTWSDVYARFNKAIKES